MKEGGGRLRGQDGRSKRYAIKAFVVSTPHKYMGRVPQVHLEDKREYKIPWGKGEGIKHYRIEDCVGRIKR